MLSLPRQLAVLERVAGAIAARDVIGVAKKAHADDAKRTA
jgi:hypothetical protein